MSLVLSRRSCRVCQVGQSQKRFQFLLSIWNFRHNNRLQFQTSCLAGFIRSCSNAKGGIEVKLANALHVGSSLCRVNLQGDDDSEDDDEILDGTLAGIVTVLLVQ